MNKPEFNPTNLDTLLPFLTAEVWTGIGGQSAVDYAAKPVLDACMRLENSALQRAGLGNVYEGSIAGEIACKILKGPGKGGLGNFDSTKPLQRYVKRMMACQAIDIYRSEKTRREAHNNKMARLELRKPDLDAREYKELLLVAADKYLGILEPDSSMALVASFCRDYLEKWSEWPQYKLVADQIGIDPVYTCTLRNRVILKITEIARALD